jgi:drug/metabolite transporter (DMT)-like permease
MTPAIAGYAALLTVGAAWGLTTPLIKTATIAGQNALTIALWCAVFNVVVLAPLALRRGGRWRLPPLDGASLRLYAVLGVLGMALPQWASMTGTTHLPAGIMSIVISLVPIFALPLALALGSERFALRRALGVGLGAVAIVLLAAPGGGGLPGPELWVWVLVGALAPFLYAIEGAYVAASRAAGARPAMLLWAASVVAVGMLAPMALGLGAQVLPSFRPGAGEWAVLGAAALSLSAYAGYIRLLQRWGAVFGAQVAYTVTGCGIGWAMLLLGERYPPVVWAALALLFVGLALVTPRARAALPGVSGGAAGPQAQAQAHGPGVGSV